MKKTLIIIIVVPLVIQSLSFTGTEINITKLWETDSVFMTPESVVYDSIRNCLYVSNFNDKGGFRNSGDTIYDECISKVDVDGNIIELRWVDHLIGPTGVSIYNDTLYVIERGYLTKIDIDNQSVVERIPINNSGFVNDIAIDKKGDIYISDMGQSSIHRITNKKCELWLTDTLLHNINGLYIDNNHLIIGNQGNSNLISVSIPDKKTRVIASNISVGIDGIKKFKKDYIVSWRYEMFVIKESGTFQIILNTESEQNWIADFELIQSKNILIVPTLLTNKLVAYMITDKQ